MTASSGSDSAPDDGYVDVTGRVRRASFSVRHAALEGLWWETLHRPSSGGGPTTTAWRGVPVGDLLDVSLVERDATHVVVHGAGGRSTTVPVEAAREGVLAMARGEKEAGFDDAPLFVTPDPDVTTVGRVTQLEVVGGDSA